MRDTIQSLAGLALGFVVGLILTSPVTLHAQAGLTDINIKVSGTWRATVQCQAQVALQYKLDGGAATPFTGLTWSGTGPYTTDIDYPATPAARTLGPHTFDIIDPGATITFADGTTQTYPPGVTTVTVHVFPDGVPTPQPPKILKWIRVAGTIAAFIAPVIWYWAKHT